MADDMHGRASIRLLAALLIAIQLVPRPLLAGEDWHLVAPESRSIPVRPPSALPPARIPVIPPPVTVVERAPQVEPWLLSLDEAIRIALANSHVVRVLTGAFATASGATIYDPAISNTQIDVERARFDPTLEIINNFNRLEQPSAVLDPLAPGGARIQGFGTDRYDFSLGLAKQNQFGGTSRFNFQTNPQRFDAAGLPLNPQTPSTAELSYTQPLLQGAGRKVNLAPIVVARINTERSFFQLKENVQELVRGVLEAYWLLVFARTDVWAREQQVEQGRVALERAEAALETGRADITEVAQARSALAGFRANLIAAQANLLAREAALRNLIGLPPTGDKILVPTTPPLLARIEIIWPALLELASERRPDLIEIKLVIEADQQLLLQARNQALPQLDATALYRWNGLEGRTPDRTFIATDPGQFTDWVLGVNFALPIGLRRGRANLRQQELILVRDRALLEQALHSTAHLLAANVRDLAQYWAQYEAFQALREAARANLEAQLAQYREGRAIYLNVLQAITDWGNAVSQEAQSLALYNIALATLERDTGTILDVHGVRFYEERYWSIGPLGLHHLAPYPKSMPPGPNGDRYPAGDRPSETVFDLRDPIPQPERPEGPDPYAEGLDAPLPDVLPPPALPELLPPTEGNGALE